MSEDDHLAPGRWPDLDQRLRRRLSALARRQLHGFDHLVDDVVARSLIKWRHIAAGKAGVARIEQVVASEARSVIRSEYRARARDTRAFTDPTLATGRTQPTSPAEDLVELRVALAAVCRQRGEVLTLLDIEVFEHLVAGASIAEVVRRLDVPRHVVRRSVLRWRSLLLASGLGPVADRPHPPTEPAITAGPKE